MKKKGLIISTVVMVVVLIASLTTATYAWFTASSKTEESTYKVMIYTYYDPFSVYYLEGLTPEDKDEFDSQLFDYLGSKYNEYFG